MKTQADNYQEAERVFDQAKVSLDECWPLAGTYQRECLVVAYDLVKKAKEEVQRAGLASKEDLKNSRRNVMGGI